MLAVYLCTHPNGRQRTVAATSNSQAKKRAAIGWEISPDLIIATKIEEQKK